MEWQMIVSLALAVLLLVAGGYIRKLINETSELFNVIKDAIADGEVTPKELAKIVKEAADVKIAAMEILKLIAKK